MKKKLRAEIDESLSKALEPPKRKPSPTLNSILNEYAPPPKEESTPVTTPVPTPVDTPVARQSLDSTHTTSEGVIYSNMYRLTVSRGIRDRHFGPKELMELTGIRSDRTVRTALDGLIAKQSIEVVWEQNGYPLGPKYRIYEPREVMRRRREAGIEVDHQTKRITPVATGVGAGGKNYPGTPVESTPVTPVDFAGDTNTKYVSNSIGKEQSDDESAPGSVLKNGTAESSAFTGLFEALSSATLEITGKLPGSVDREKWNELGDILTTELRIAAARTTVSNVPAFLAEHLRRRLWKKDGRQVAQEAVENSSGGQQTPAMADSKNCPDCGGTGYFYPEGYDRGVARCLHLKLESKSE